MPERKDSPFILDLAFGQDNEAASRAEWQWAQWLLYYMVFYIAIQ
jgi:hypothetical protein